MLSVFLTIFYPIFLTSIAVGPVFITIANISIISGVKNGLFSVIGVIIGNITYTTIGVLTAQQVISAIPDKVMLFVSFFATLFLIYIAVGFWRRDLSNIDDDKLFKPSLQLVLKMFTVTLSSPLAIAGYVTTFLTFANVVKQSLLFSWLGAVSATLVVYPAIALFFGFLGGKFKKMKKEASIRYFTILNRSSSVLLAGFASITLFKFVKTIIIMFVA